MAGQWPRMVRTKATIYIESASWLTTLSNKVQITYVLDTQKALCDVSIYVINWPSIEPRHALVYTLI